MEDDMSLKGRRPFSGTLKLATGLFFMAILGYGCADINSDPQKTVENALRAAHEKNYDRVRQLIDFDGMVDIALQEQKPPKVLDSGQRKKLIDELVRSVCEISREDLDKSLQSLRVEIDKKDPTLATALYDSTKRPGVTLTLEKRKKGWIITEVN